MAYLQFYQGYYTGGTPTVLSANPFDVAQDLSTGNLWQYTGNAWVAPSWNSAITFYLGGATTVCERLNSEYTKYPDTISLYIGTDPLVPADLALSADDLAIKHDLANYSVQVSVFRRDTTTDTVVEVPFPEGNIISTEDGNWTILKNLNEYVGFDYCTVALTWTSVGGQIGPQVLDFVTSAQVQDMIDSAMVSVSGVLSSGAEIDTQVGEARFQLTSGGVTVQYGRALPKTWSITASGLSYTDTYDENNKSVIISVGGAGNIDIVCNDDDLGSYAFSLNTQSLYLFGDAGYSILGEFTGLHIDNAVWLTSALVFSSTSGLETAVVVDLVNYTDLGITGGSHVWFNGEPLLTSADLPPQMVEVVDSTSTSAYIPVLSGGTCYKFTQPLLTLFVGRIDSSLREASILFSAGARQELPATIGVNFKMGEAFHYDDDDTGEGMYTPVYHGITLVSSGAGYIYNVPEHLNWYDVYDNGAGMYYSSYLSGGLFTGELVGGTAWILSAIDVVQQCYIDGELIDNINVNGEVASADSAMASWTINSALVVRGCYYSEPDGYLYYADTPAGPIDAVTSTVPCDVVLPPATPLVNSSAVRLSSGAVYEMNIQYGAVVTAQWLERQGE